MQEIDREKKHREKERIFNGKVWLGLLICYMRIGGKCATND